MDNARKILFVLFHAKQWRYDSIKLNSIELETVKNVKNKCRWWVLVICQLVTQFLISRHGGGSQNYFRQMSQLKTGSIDASRNCVTQLCWPTCWRFMEASGA